MKKAGVLTLLVFINSLQLVTAQALLDSCYTSAAPSVSFISSATLINSFDADLLEWTGTSWNGAYPNANVNTAPPCNTLPVRAVWIGDSTVWTTGGEAYGLKLDAPLVAGNTYWFFFTYVSVGLGSNGAFSPEVYTNNTGANNGTYVGNFVPAGYSWVTNPISFTASAAQAGDEYLIIHTIDGSGMVLNLCAETLTDLGNDSLTICIGDTVVLQGGSGFQSYSWSTGETTQQISVHNSGTYISTNQGLCGVSSDTIVITVDPCGMFPVAVFSTPDNHICPGTCTDFTNLSQNSLTYQWTFGGATPNISTDVNPTGICYNSPGTYAVQLIATNALTSDTLTLNNFITVYPSPLPQGIMQSGDTLFANPGAAGYQWYQDGNLIPGATEYFYVAGMSGDYNVVATDDNGCEVEAVVFDVIAGIAPHDRIDDLIAVSPVPANAALTISSGSINGEKAMVTIYNILGEKISAQLCLIAESSITVDVSALSSGTYFVEIESGGKKLRSRFVRE